MAKASKRAGTKPKVRKIWAINPKTRVKPSAKIYHRAKEKQRGRAAVSRIDWFGESE